MSTGIIASKYHSFSMYKKYGTGDKATAIKRKIVAMCNAGFLPICIGRVLLKRLSPSLSRISIMISRLIIIKKAIRDNINEEYGFPTDAPPKVNDIADTNATVMLPLMLMFFEYFS